MKFHDASADHIPHDEEVALLRTGVLMTRNGHPQGPLEKVLLVNHRETSRQATVSKWVPIRKRPIPIPHGAKPEDPKSYGFGLFYIPPFASEPCKFFNTGEEDTSIHPLNYDPVHEGIQHMDEFDKEKTAGNRWLLGNLACGSISRLPEVIKLPCARLPSFKRSILRQDFESSCQNVLSRDEPKMTSPKSPVRIKTANPASIPSELLDPFYTLRFKETNILSEPLPQHSSKSSSSLQRLTKSCHNEGDIDDLGRLAGQSLNHKETLGRCTKPTLQFPPLPCSVPPQKHRPQKAERWSLSRPPAPLAWKKEVEWAMKGYTY
ncbi:hypothetical protein BC829DRAFT_383062 [Chytridium lagenaria]|nr:hypothetical protein BC829DRAFT_383062 [Chytridium lagenaria]